MAKATPAKVILAKATVMDRGVPAAVLQRGKALVMGNFPPPADKGSESQEQKRGARCGGFPPW
ncbi:MAG: hypothetical protein OJF47_002603 [Nitrospira sp.]|nr:MAG: hypothetical protein OJF47_002603 [Nitrospira sp.]